MGSCKEQVQMRLRVEKCQLGVEVPPSGLSLLVEPHFHFFQHLRRVPVDNKQNSHNVHSWSYGAILFYQKWVFATQKKRFLFFWQPKKEIFFFGSQKRKSSFLVPKKGKSSFLVPKKGKLLFWCLKKEKILFFGHF